MLVSLCDLVFRFDAGIQVSESVKIDVKAIETGAQVLRTRDVWETMSNFLIDCHAGATSAAGDVLVRTFFLFSFFFSSLSIFRISWGNFCMGYARRATPGRGLSYHGRPRLRLLSPFKSQPVEDVHVYQLTLAVRPHSYFLRPHFGWVFASLSLSTYYHWNAPTDGAGSQHWYQSHFSPCDESWFHPALVSANEIDPNHHPLSYFCNALLTVAFFALQLFLLNSLLVLSLSISLPHLPHLRREAIIAQVYRYLFTPFVSITAHILGPAHAFVFFIYFIGYQNLPAYRPGESIALRVLGSLFMLPLWGLMIMGGFLAFGIGAWGLLAGRWLARLNPIRRVHEWIELRSVDELERGWESRSRGLLSGIRTSEDQPKKPLSFSGVMVVCSQEPVAAPAAPLSPAFKQRQQQQQQQQQHPFRRICPPTPPPEPVVIGPTQEELQALREGCKRINELRERMRGRMVEMKVEIDKISGNTERGPLSPPLPSPQHRYRNSPLVSRNSNPPSPLLPVKSS
ncbi:hypothetical protein HOY80DRAFT_996268 [Tuber brumale]|nr:hypothetical protein HOY80DRAFT_996268 [Tuber brumale]